MTDRSSPSAADAKRWAAQWREAASMLADERRRELRAMSPAEALRVADELLALADPASLPRHRITWSGLVEQQALFHGK